MEATTGCPARLPPTPTFAHVGFYHTPLEGFQDQRGRCLRKNRSQLPWKMSSMASDG